MVEQSAPLVDEASRLFTAVQQWARDTFPAPGPGGELGPDCQWCPICQFLSVLRGERPEVTERVSEAGTAVFTMFRALLDGAAQHAHQGAPHPPPPPRVQHIDLGGAP